MVVSCVTHPRTHNYRVKRNWTRLSKDKETLPKLIEGVAWIICHSIRRDTPSIPPTKMRGNTQIQTHPILLHGICKKDIQTQRGKGEEIDHLHHAVEDCECGEV